MPLGIDLVAAGVVVGVVSALFGVGGGIVIVPFMVVVLGEAQHVSEGTSLLITIPTSLAGALAHRKRDYVSFPHSRLLAVGGVGGAYVGALLALALPAKSLSRAFGVVLMVVGVRVVLQGRRRIQKERRAPIPAAETPPASG